MRTVETKISETAPDWYKYVADNARLNLREISVLLGLHYDTLRFRVYHGNFPPPDEYVRPRKGKPRPYWRVSTVKKFARVD